MMGRARYVVGGVLVSLLLFAGVIALSQWPRWQSLPEDAAMIRLSLRHSGLRTCRTATEEELAKLPPNMRRKEICDRHRPPIRVELAIDDTLVYAREVPPSGLWGTGPSRVYESFEVPAGNHRIAVRMADDPASDAFGHSLTRDLALAPGRNLAIDFDPDRGGFVIFE